MAHGARRRRARAGRARTLRPGVRHPLRRAPGPARMTSLRGRVVALSPHLDDAVWSIGGALADAVRSGADVMVATVLAGDPSSRGPAGYWDKRCGFRSAGKAAEVRQAEDRRACAALGARAIHLPYWDESYERGGDDGEIWAA